MANYNMNWKLFGGTGLFLAGVVFGGYLFAGSQPRSFLAVLDCRKSCYQKKELAGLLTSVGIHRADGVLPLIVKETDRCLAIHHPSPMAKLHYVVFPKKDIKNIADISVDDQDYVLDCLALVRTLVLDNNLRNYRVYTNGPGMQDITYLHFHIVSGEPARFDSEKKADVPQRDTQTPTD